MLFRCLDFIRSHGSFAPSPYRCGCLPFILVIKALRHIGERECASLFRQHRMKEHLQQHVAQFLAHEFVLAEANGFVELVSLFDQVGSKRFVRLRRVPFAACAKIAHESQRIVERVCACLIHRNEILSHTEVSADEVS